MSFIKPDDETENLKIRKSLFSHCTCLLYIMHWFRGALLTGLERLVCEMTYKCVDGDVKPTHSVSHSSGTYIARGETVGQQRLSVLCDCRMTSGRVRTGTWSGRTRSSSFTASLVGRVTTRRGRISTQSHSISASPAKTFRSPSSATKWISNDTGQCCCSLSTHALRQCIFTARRYA